jgi:hypothetical protein
MNVAMAPREQQPGKYRTALVLAVIAAAFFIAVIVRHWPW